MPDFGVRYPYGLAESGVTDDVLAGYFARDLVVLLGDADTVREDDDLRKSPEAELQGPQRFDRGPRQRRDDAGGRVARRLAVTARPD